ncbi:MAG: Trk system potassium transporter TrkA [Acidobacteria bacterium]|nr:MAG: Trk system potassium transporter TrkA [Acidobacteriota bacterium]
MDIIVIGAGEVGYHLAKELSSRDHNVVVVDISHERLERIGEQLDVTTLCGNGAHLDVLQRAEAETCDLLLAVSNKDNVNLVASRLAKGLGARRSVVRSTDVDAVVSRRGLYSSLFDVDLLLSTQLLTTSRIVQRVRRHHNQIIEEYLGGKVQIRRVSVTEGSRAAGRMVADLGLPAQTLVVALFRDDEVLVPWGDTVIEVGDQLLMAAASGRMPQVEKLFSQADEDLGTIIVAGGGRMAVAVCQALTNYTVRLKVIERDKSRCRELAKILPQAIVLLGQATETALLEEEHVEKASQFLAMTGDDETNVVASLLARDLGAEGIVTLVHRPDMLALCERMGLDGTVSPRLIAAERILEYIDSDFVSNIASVAGGRAQVFERVVCKDSPIAGCTLAELDLPPGALVVSVQRGDEIWVPHGNDTIEPGDLVVFFAASQVLEEAVAALQSTRPAASESR